MGLDVTLPAQVSDGKKFGSSDTWLVKKGFKCFNQTTDAPESEETCGFGSDGFDTATSKTFKTFPKVSFNISYGDGYGTFVTNPSTFVLIMY